MRRCGRHFCGVRSLRTCSSTWLGRILAERSYEPPSGTASDGMIDCVSAASAHRWWRARATTSLSTPRRSKVCARFERGTFDVAMRPQTPATTRRCSASPSKASVAQRLTTKSFVLRATPLPCAALPCFGSTKLSMNSSPSLRMSSSPAADVSFPPLRLRAFTGAADTAASPPCCSAFAFFSQKGSVAVHGPRTTSVSLWCSSECAWLLIAVSRRSADLQQFCPRSPDSHWARVCTCSATKACRAEKSLSEADEPSPVWMHCTSAFAASCCEAADDSRDVTSVRVGEVVRKAVRIDTPSSPWSSSTRMLRPCAASVLLPDRSRHILLMRRADAIWMERLGSPYPCLAD
eukprot:Rhum_TRINITY_DN13884_c1_g1::Rhum_TRINITY_DN13884_c1_g1_i1::g.65386::m.65386